MKNARGKPGGGRESLSRPLAFLRRKRGAPRPNFEREQVEYAALRAAERALAATSWYRDRLDNPGGRYEHR